MAAPAVGPYSGHGKAAEPINLSDILPDDLSAALPVWFYVSEPKNGSSRPMRVTGLDLGRRYEGPQASLWTLNCGDKQYVLPLGYAVQCTVSSCAVHGIVLAGEDGGPLLQFTVSSPAGGSAVIQQSHAAPDTARNSWTPFTAIAEAAAQKIAELHNRPGQKGHKPTGPGLWVQAQGHAAWRSYLSQHFSPTTVISGGTLQQMHRDMLQLLADSPELAEEGWCIRMGRGQLVLSKVVTLPGVGSQIERQLVIQSDKVWEAIVLQHQCPAVSIADGLPPQLDSTVAGDVLRAFASMHICTGLHRADYLQLIAIHSQPGTFTKDASQLHTKLCNELFENAFNVFESSEQDMAIELDKVSKNLSGNLEAAAAADAVPTYTVSDSEDDMDLEGSGLLDKHTMHWHARVQLLRAAEDQNCPFQLFAGDAIGARLGSSAEQHLQHVPQ